MFFFFVDFDNDHRVQNNQDCLCGDKMLCTTETGKWCKGNAGTCSLTGPCVNKDFSAVNAEACNCGSAVCSGNNLWCFEAGECGIFVVFLFLFPGVS